MSARGRRLASWVSLGVAAVLALLLVEQALFALGPGRVPARFLPEPGLLGIALGDQLERRGDAPEREVLERRAEALAAEARRRIAAGFAALAPEGERQRVEVWIQFALAGVDLPLDELWTGTRVEVIEGADGWTVRGGGPDVQSGKPLWEAVQRAGPWGRVVVRGRTPAPGGAIGVRSWQGGPIDHPGPVRIEGGPLGGISFGESSPALWIEGCEILAAPTAGSIVGVSQGQIAPGPVVLRGCRLGSTEPGRRVFNAHPNKWGVRAHGQVAGGLAFLGCRFDETDEHGLYISNSQTALLVSDCTFAATTRTNVQIVNRVGDGPRAHGPVVLENLRLVVPRRLATGGRGVGGGSGLTIAGHTGPVAIRDVVFSTAPASFEGGSHNGLVAIWCEPPPEAVHRLESGHWTEELVLLGLEVGAAGDTLPYTPDRPSVMISGVARALVEAPPAPRVGLGGQGPERLVFNGDGADADGARREVGELTYLRPPGEAPWRLDGRAGLTRFARSGEPGLWRR